MTKYFHKIIRKLYNHYFINSINSYYRLHFFILSYLHNIKINKGKNIQFNMRTICNGKGTIKINDNVVFGFRLGGFVSQPIMIQPRYPESLIEIKEHTYIMQGCEIIACENIIIGSNCRIGSGSVIYDTDFHDLNPMYRDKIGKVKPVVIGNNVWFGINVIVLKGVHIGNDAVIGASCVVTKNIPDGSIVVGNPMKIIGSVYSQ